MAARRSGYQVALVVCMCARALVWLPWSSCWFSLCDGVRCARARPYHVGNTGSRLITEVKQRWARLVLAWVTGWEYRVLRPFCTPSHNQTHTHKLTHTHPFYRLIDSFAMLHRNAVFSVQVCYGKNLASHNLSTFYM